MTAPPRSRPSLRVAAHLDLSLTAPDGSTSLVTVRDRAGEVFVDIDRPVAALKSLPAAVDVRALVRVARRALRTGAPDLTRLPPVRLRVRGVTVALAGDGRARPATGLLVGTALVAAAVVASVAALVVGAAAGVARLGARR